TTPNAGVGALPTVFQCTWRAVPGRRDFFFGAVLAGYECSATGTWITVLRRARFDLVREAAEGRGFNFDTSPRRDKDGDGGTRFGNCGETYPFLNILTYVPCVPYFLSYFFFMWVVFVSFRRMC